MRRTIGNGMRQINLLLIPCAAGIMVLATPITRLVFQHGSFKTGSTHDVSIALFWFAWSLPFAGINLLLTRTFFALQRPWIPTRYAAYNIVVDIIVSLALYKPFGIAGLVIGTAVANMMMTALELNRMRIGFNGRLELDQTAMITIRILVASIITAAIARGVYTLVDAVVGRSVPGQLISVGLAVAAGGFFYARAVLAMRIPEARQIEALILGRLGRGR
jgi:putative peptidoglycan lipid II flippase